MPPGHTVTSLPLSTNFPIAFLFGFTSRSPVHVSEGVYRGQGVAPCPGQTILSMRNCHSGKNLTKSMLMTIIYVAHPPGVEGVTMPSFGAVSAFLGLVLLIHLKFSHELSSEV